MAYSTMPPASREPLLLSRLMDRGPALQPSNILICKTTAGHDVVTMAQHAARVRQLARALSAWGVQIGDRVATLCWNTNRHLQCYHAIPSLGAVLHTLNVRLGPSELGYIVQHAKDRVVVVDSDLLPGFAGIDVEFLQDVELVIVCGEDEGAWNDAGDGATATAAAELRRKGVKRVVGWEALVDAQPADAAGFAWPDFDEQSPACLCYTSGTTGAPKGVVYSHRAMYLHTLAMPMPDSHNISGADVLLPVVPYFHANGWGIPFMALMLGTRVVHNARFTDPATILQLCCDFAVTYSAAVPAIWMVTRAALERESDKYSGKFKVRQVVCGGSAPPAEMMQWYADAYGCQFIQGWGMTETSPMGTFARPVAKYEHLAWDDKRRFSNVAKTGLFSPAVQAKIVDTEDFSKPLPHDGVAQGELLVRGPWVTERYYENPQPTKFTEDGWLATGDIASIDTEGYLLIRDRSKDVIKSGGEWISSVDLENHIVGMPAVEEAAVVAVPHPKWDERPVCIVVRAPGSASADLSIEAVRAHCLAGGTFAKYECPDDVLLWAELPKTGTGKLDKKSIRTALQQQGYQLPDLRDARSKL